MNAGLELSWNWFFNRDASYAITAIESELPRTRTLRFAVGSSRNARQARPAVRYCSLAYQSIQLSPLQ